MTVVLEIPPEKEAIYARLAEAKGMSLPDFFQRLADEAAWQTEVQAKNERARALLKQWGEENKTDWDSLSEEEQEAAKEKWDEFKDAIDKSRLSERPRFMEHD